MIVTARDHTVRPSVQPGNCHNLARQYDAANDELLRRPFVCKSGSIG